jgi:deazaflavin-dependent oxidoreductase (nitroreductase family)
MNVSLAPKGPQPASRRHLFGIRAPGRLMLAVFRLPLDLYRRGWGRLLGHTFLLFVHAGRRTGARHEATAMVLRFDELTNEAVIFSAWGPNADWVRNLHVRPALQVQIGHESFVPEQRFLTEDEAFTVVVNFRREHPWRVRFATKVLGWDDLGSGEAVREFVRARPFVAFRPSRTVHSA